MTCGVLSIVYEHAHSALCWTWTAEDKQANKKSLRRMSEAELGATLKDFQDRWKKINNSLQKDRRHIAKQRLQSVCRDLTARLVPPDLDLAELAGRDALIRVVVDPDALPIECIDAGGLPMAVRYRLLHTKSEQQARGPVPAAVPWVPRALLVAMPIDARGTRHQAHSTAIRDELIGIYGEGGWPSLAGSNATVVGIAEGLYDPENACFYFFGHGDRDNGLNLGDGSLSGAYLRSRPSECPKRPGSFAFLNCCWSAAPVLAPGAVDPARALVECGWTTVIGTVLPPLDTVAAPFGEAFFKGLRCSCCNVHEAFFGALGDCWNRYGGDDPELRAFGWPIYRIFGVERHPYLRTPFISASGDLGYGDWSLGPARELRLEPQHWVLLARLIPNDATDERSFFTSLLAAPGLETVARAAMAAFVRRGASPLPDLSRRLAALLNLLARSRGEAAARQMVPVADLERALELDPGSIAITLLEERWAALEVTEEGAEFLLQVHRLWQDGVTPGEIRSRIGNKQRLTTDRQTLQWFIRTDAEIAAIVRAAIQVANDDTAMDLVRRADVFNLWTVAYLQAIAEGKTRRPRDAEMQVDLAPECNTDLVDDTAVAALSLARDRRERRGGNPYWWHLITVLHEDFPDIFRSQNLDILKFGVLLDNASRIIMTADTTEELHHTVPAWIAVGHWFYRLPASFRTPWRDAIEEAASELENAGDAAQVVLVLPWDPQPDPFTDALAQEVREVCNRSSCSRGRHWVHVDEAELIRRARPTRLVDLLSRESRGAMRDSLRGLKGKATLVVSGRSDLRRRGRADWEQEVDGLLRLLTTGRTRSLFLVSNTDGETLDYFGSKGLNRIHFAAPDHRLDHDRVLELIWRRELATGQPPDEDALAALMALVDLEAGDGLRTAIAVWTRACELARGQRPTLAGVEAAIREWEGKRGHRPRR